MKLTIANGPFNQIDDWDDFVATRYKQGKSEEEFRNYKADANPKITEFYGPNLVQTRLA
jgi:inositol oxygenase